MLRAAWTARHFAALCIAALAGIAALAASSPPGHAEETTGIRFIGRFDSSDPKAVRFGWSGSAIEFTFTGTTLSAELSDGGDNSYVVDVDGVISRLDLRKGLASYVLAQDLPAGPHRVRIVRRTEAFFWPTAFHGATTDGEFTPARDPGRQILMIGDSMAAGYGVEGKDVKCSFSPGTQNQYLTYAAVAGRAFDADVTTIAWSGYGIVRNSSGSGDATMLTVMDRTIPVDADGPPPAPENPAVIVVHVGTNDFVDAGSGKTFRPAYDGLLKTLRTRHPEAMIYAAMGPMLQEALLKEALAIVNAAVEARKAEGDAKIGFIPFTLIGPGLRGCDWHPNIAGHQAMADTLIARIEKDLSWKRAVPTGKTGALNP